LFVTDLALRIFDAAGRLMRSMLSSRDLAGPNTWFWDGRDTSGRAVASGAYFYELSAGGKTEDGRRQAGHASVDRTERDRVTPPARGGLDHLRTGTPVRGSFGTARFHVDAGGTEERGGGPTGARGYLRIGLTISPGAF
jgi:hypothetical protein